jgi:hypothetical protein
MRARGLLVKRTDLIPISQDIGHLSIATEATTTNLTASRIALIKKTGIQSV